MDQRVYIFYDVYLHNYSYLKSDLATPKLFNVVNVPFHCYITVLAFIPSLLIFVI